MSKLHVEFHEGWTGDRVEVRIRDALRYAGQPVTRPRTGYAGGLVVDVNKGTVSLDVRVAARSAGTTRTLEIGDELWVGLSLDATGLRVVDRPTPFG